MFVDCNTSNEWEDKHGSKITTTRRGAPQTSADARSLFPAREGTNYCGLSVRDMKDGGRATS